MVIEAVLQAIRIGEIHYWFLFTPEAAFHYFHFWRFFTYPFLNEPSIWFLMEMGMLFFFGREVERSVGRRNFLFLYSVLLLLPPVAITFLQLFGIATAGLAGSWNINFAVFIAFVALYPRMEFFFGIAAKWVAIALVGIHSLELLEGRSWISLVLFWLECGAAILLIRMIHTGRLAFLWNFKPWYFFRKNISLGKQQNNRVFSTPSVRKKSDEAKHHSVDLILEKISRLGIGSLTHSERECLEKARSTLLKKEKHLQ